MNQKLIALDLDGTTLNNESQVNPETVAAVARATARGHIVSIVTGRSTRLALPAYQALKLKTPMINFNGSLGLTPKEKWAGAYSFPIQKSIALALLENSKALGIELMVAEGPDTLLATAPATHQLANKSAGFFPETLTEEQRLTKAHLTEAPIALAVAYQPAKLPVLKEYLATQFDGQVAIYPWGGPLSVLEIKATGIEKDYGVNALAKHFQIAKPDIIAIGDQINDLALLAAAGTKVAMRNAVPAVKAVANVVTQYDNHHNGVARYLNEMI